MTTSNSNYAPLPSSFPEGLFFLLRKSCAIFLSSLTRYYQFLTCSTWGFWHYEIHLDEWLQTPVRFPEDKKLSARILSALQELEKRGDPSPLFGSSTYEENLEKLDEAIFDLYGLSDEQKDLIRDFCNVTLEFYYEGSKAEALKAPSISELERYSEAFLEVWRDRLKKRGKELEVNIFAPKDALLCGISFELKNLGRAKKRETVKDNAEWKNWLNRLSTSLRAKLDSGIYVDKVFKELTDSSMLIIKRAERRLWTKSQARQDAHELLTEVFKLEWQQDKSVA